TGQREGVGRNDADVGLAVDEAVGGEVLGVDHGIVDIGEDLELVGHPGVVAVGAESIGDAAIAPLRLDERLDHAFGLRLLADPFVAENCHASGDSGVGAAGQGAVRTLSPFTYKSAANSRAA